MTTIDPGVTGRAIEPLAVSPKQACLLLSIGNTHLYDLLHAGELDSYLDGSARKITVESIRRRIARLLAAAGSTTAAVEAAPSRRRGRPRKVSAKGAQA
jgi:excisionase family DNA binding protein